MDLAETQQAHVRFAEPLEPGQNDHDMEHEGSAEPADSSSADADPDSGWLSKPIVEDLLQHEMDDAIQKIFLPHLNHIESQVSTSRPLQQAEKGSQMACCVAVCSQVSLTTTNPGHEKTVCKDTLQMIQHGGRYIGDPGCLHSFERRSQSPLTSSSRMYQMILR